MPSLFGSSTPVLQTIQGLGDALATAQNTSPFSALSRPDTLPRTPVIANQNATGSGFSSGATIPTSGLAQRSLYSLNSGFGGNADTGGNPALGALARLRQSSGANNPQGNGFGQIGNISGLANVGGGFAMADQFNSAIGAAAQQFGVPANLVKAILVNESQGDWNSNNWINNLRGERMLPFSGIFESTARSWGLNFDQMSRDPAAQIAGIAKILSGLARQYGGFENAAKVYFGGEQALHGGFIDENGLSSNAYFQHAMDNWHLLDQKAGFSGGQVAPINGQWGGNPVGNSIVNIATSFVGKVPYVWGAIPGKGETPTGWDCSGFTYWLNQNYGDGQLPRGSHFQYQYAQQTGRLFTNLSQLQPGDLVFIDTGWYGGAQPQVPNRAGHVAMYIGNGQIVHAANPNTGTIISSLSAYGGVLGAMHQSWSGGSTAFGTNTGVGTGSMIPSGPHSVASGIQQFLQGRR